MKNWLKGTLSIIGIVGSFSLLLTGCQPKPAFTNSSDDVLYNGSVVTVVGEHLLYSNGYKSDEITTMANFNDFAKSTYLATVKSENVKDKYVSPEGVQKVKGTVTGYSNMYSFVYGNNVYYAAPNTGKTSSNQHVFSYVTFFKCNFAGGGTKELFTTRQYDSTKAVVRALKFGDNAYFMVYDGTDFNCINLNTSKRKTIENVTSVAIPRENEQWNGKVYYTKNGENTLLKGNEAFKYDVLKDESEPLGNQVNYTVSFVGRSEDEVFYTIVNEAIASDDTTNEQSYHATAASLESSTITTAGEFLYSGTISNIYSIGGDLEQYKGYIFTSSLSGSAQEYYYSIQDDACSLMLNNSAFTNILFTYSDLVYYSNADGIYYKSLSNDATTTVVSGMTIIANKVGYDYYSDGSIKNIYFYAQRVYDPDDETEEADRDTNYYLYVKDAMMESDALLVGKTVK